MGAITELLSTLIHLYSRVFAGDFAEISEMER
ncbi:MAG: hypothetical protein RL433_574 [Actinomycetota bacterium]|jgi:hypothetical protein